MVITGKQTEYAYKAFEAHFAGRLNAADVVGIITLDALHISMIHARRVSAIALTLVVLLALVPAPAAAADVTLTVTVQTEDGTQVSGAELTATWSNGSVIDTTAANGKAFLDVPEGETVELTVADDEYMRNGPIVIEDASETDVTMTVRPIAEATISVANGGGPIDDALVTLSQDGTTVVSERTTDGTVQTGEIEAGSYQLAVEKSGFYAVEETLEVPADESITHDVTLEEGTVTMQVEVTDPYFDPPRALQGVTVTVDGHGSVNTQSNGQQQLSVPVNTDLTVRFEAPAYETVEKSVKTAEESVSLDVELDRRNRLVVTAHTTTVVVGQPAFISVMDEYDDPVENATVLHNGEAVTETDSEGWARIPIETAGTHEIQVDDGEITSNVTEVAAITAETAEPPETDTETDGTTGDGETTTADSTGAPIPGFGPIVGLLGVVLGIGIGLVGRRAA
ncbi:MAG: carboxypeptidase-like regulatory domain-containing protein [Halodesulfurarchaeum sp.]|nr:carboxypeptidase-like regulatory domain-containing protein [Halodesulfurarchaeum sp.]